MLNYNPRGYAATTVFEKLILRKEEYRNVIQLWTEHFSSRFCYLLAGFADNAIRERFLLNVVGGIP
jgi:hypothetical protein